jgi:rhodanese-related sulfurtransferase
VAIAAAAFVAIFAAEPAVSAIVIAAGVIGYIGGRCARAASPPAAVTARRSKLRCAVIDDTTPTPRPCTLLLGRLHAGRLVGSDCGRRHGCADRAPTAWDATLTQMGWFFTKAALLTFGGAYAVLPYVYQGAVEHYQWITAAADDRRPRARRDHARPAHHGGRLRRLRRRLGQAKSWDPMQLFLAGASATVRHLLHVPAELHLHPAGGPLVETTHGDLKFTAPLTGITAAVVGVILNLACSSPGMCSGPWSQSEKESAMNRSIHATELKELLDTNTPLTILDLRRPSDYDPDTGVVPGARWLSLENIEEWSVTLPRDREIVLYCAHGKTISNAALDRLLAVGFRARFIEGGMDGWKEARGQLAPKP